MIAAVLAVITNPGVAFPFGSCMFCFVLGHFVGHTNGFARARRHYVASFDLPDEPHRAHHAVFGGNRPKKPKHA